MAVLVWFELLVSLLIGLAGVLTNLNVSSLEGVKLFAAFFAKWVGHEEISF